MGGFENKQLNADINHKVSFDSDENSMMKKFTEQDTNLFQNFTLIHNKSGSQVEIDHIRP